MVCIILQGLTAGFLKGLLMVKRYYYISPETLTHVHAHTYVELNSDQMKFFSKKR